MRMNIGMFRVVYAKKRGLLYSKVIINVEVMTEEKTGDF